MKFENLKYCENHYTNRWYYMAFIILYDTEYFGVYTNYANYDSTMDNEEIISLQNFLCENKINTISDIMNRKDEIISYLISRVEEC